MPAPGSQLSRAAASECALAIELNDELTILLSGIRECVDETDGADPVLVRLIHMQDAAERCAHKAQLLLEAGARRGGLPRGPVSFERLVSE